MSNGAQMIRLLGAVSLVCGLAIVATQRGTLARIRHNQETIMRESVARLLPGIHKQIIYGIAASGQLTILTGLESGGPRFFAGYDADGNFLGVVIEASERGYADVISAMYAYSPDTQTITGFQVIDMKETPGLGNKIGTDPEFLDNFKHLDATHPISAVKHGAKKNPWEIDAISGATISSRAVGRMLDKSVAEITPAIRRNIERIKRGQ
ncbi:MAG TPA: FMN-binding protein [Bryobacteraceae bacterium]|nr:FMN-binding protein [Bryobacteraceae bacterium]